MALVVASSDDVTNYNDFSICIDLQLEHNFTDHIIDLALATVIHSGLHS